MCALQMLIERQTEVRKKGNQDSCRIGTGPIMLNCGNDTQAISPAANPPSPHRGQAASSECQVCTKPRSGAIISHGRRTGAAAAREKLKMECRLKPPPFRPIVHRCSARCVRIRIVRTHRRRTVRTRNASKKWQLKGPTVGKCSNHNCTRPFRHRFVKGCVSISKTTRGQAETQPTSR